MSECAQAVITRQVRHNMLATIALVRASLRKLEPYDQPHAYTADESEPYYASSDRFIRAVETCL